MRDVGCVCGDAVGAFLGSRGPFEIAVHPGDLTTRNKLSEFEAVATTWFKVFPGDRRSDGGTVTRLFLTGNHDVDGFAYAGAKFKTR